MTKDKKVHQESAKGLKKKADLKVFWNIGNREPESYYEDDFGKECYCEGRMIYRIEVEEITFEEAEHIHDKQDGDYDFSATILYITDLEGNIEWGSKERPAQLFDTHSYGKYKDVKTVEDKFYYAEKMIEEFKEMNRLKGKEWDRRIEQFRERMKYKALDKKREQEGGG